MGITATPRPFTQQEAIYVTIAEAPKMAPTSRLGRVFN